MWIRTIENGTTYGGISSSGDIAIINDHKHIDPEDIDYHFAAISLVTIDTRRANVVEVDTGVVLFTPNDTTTLGLYACSVPHVKLPSLEGVMESKAKVVVDSDRMEAVIRAFSLVAAKYTCVPVTIGSKVFMSFTAKGRSWDMVVLCGAQKTTKSIVDTLSEGWLAGTYEPQEILDWSNVPRKARLIIARQLGIVNKRMRDHHEKKLTSLSPTKTFKGLPLECIYDIGKAIGLSGKDMNAHDVLKALQGKQ